MPVAKRPSCAPSDLSSRCVSAASEAHELYSTFHVDVRCRFARESETVGPHRMFKFEWTYSGSDSDIVLYAEAILIHA